CKSIEICFLLSDYINSFQINALKKGFIFQQRRLKMRLKKVVLIKEEYLLQLQTPHNKEFSNHHQIESFFSRNHILREQNVLEFLKTLTH
ncbi:hypothetical protein ACR9KY_05805, partial [Helicobacter pylori]